MSPVSKQTLSAFFFDSGIDAGRCSVELPDEQYALPDAEWIGGDFRIAFKYWRKDMISDYHDGDSDCDDYAECASFFAHFLHRHSVARPLDCGLAFGSFWFTRRDGVGHAINVAVCHVRGKLEAVFFEPQQAQVIFLTLGEIQSAYSIRF